LWAVVRIHRRILQRHRRLLRRLLSNASRPASFNILRTRHLPINCQSLALLKKTGYNQTAQLQRFNWIQRLDSGFTATPMATSDQLLAKVKHLLRLIPPREVYLIFTRQTCDALKLTSEWLTSKMNCHHYSLCSPCFVLRFTRQNFAHCQFANLLVYFIGFCSSIIWLTESQFSGEFLSIKARVSNTEQWLLRKSRNI